MSNDLEIRLAVAQARYAEAEAAARRARAAEEMRRVELDTIEREAKASNYPVRVIFKFFRVSVQYAQNDRIYVYGIVQPSPGKFFTTGRKSNDYFSSWEKLVDWLRDAYWHSPIVELEDGVEVQIS